MRPIVVKVAADTPQGLMVPVIKDAELTGVLLDGPEGMRLWKRYLKLGEPEPYEARHLLPQISSMVVFDYLISNAETAARLVTARRSAL